MDNKTIETRLRMGLPVPKVRSLSSTARRKKPRFDRQYREDLRADRVFREGQTARPHRKRGTSTEPEAFKRAFVVAAPGSGPIIHRDRRHPDLKRRFKGQTTAGLPNQTVRKYKHQWDNTI